jgi:type I restriction enzyme, R subunit
MTTAPRSLNFGFLAAHDLQLVSAASEAERLFAAHPAASLMMLRVFGELLARRVAASAGLYLRLDEGQAELLRRLAAERVITRDVGELFHALREAGNRAAHAFHGDHRTALQGLRYARELGLWFHRGFGGARDYKAGPFVPPPDPQSETRALAEELARLRAALSEVQGAHEAARALAEHEADLRAEAQSQAARAVSERAEWEELAALTEDEKAALQAELKALQDARAAAPATVQRFVKAAEQASEKVVLDEAETRLLIDQQLRRAGWEADSAELTYGAGARPEPHRFRAIAEWPCESGPADYVLLHGLTAVGVVEAKRQALDVKGGALEQAKRYSRGLVEASGPESGPWGLYRVPFLFSTNGRPYLRQHKQKSGIQFIDVRRKHNHDDALEDWYTPEGLKGLLGQDIAKSEEELARESFAYLKLRPYQVHVIRKVEERLAEGARDLLVAMATGTGKTKTAIGLIYRLLKTKRFRRVLFVVDRNALGEQSDDAFSEMRLEGMRTFAEIFAVKGPKSKPKDTDPNVHIATVQAFVKRVLYSEAPPPVDEYDLIVVDECHRGYVLDRELGDDELGFRDEADYISKYRRVLDHFDAVKIGLTATPALHTVDIFGAPVASYSYRQAVVEGYLIDHEPPLQLLTQNSADGITYKAGEEMLLDGATGTVETVTLEDDVELDIDSFNRRVITESFNRVAAEWLAQHIDPTLDEKTLVFCVSDAHADLVVTELKRAFDAVYGSIDDDLVKKITGRSDQPQQLIRRYKNERDPSVAVTVDLLTTGVDVPRICNLVFLRRVRSRLLYDQMLGRATRLCPEIKKSVFRVFDAVRLYEALAPVSEMKPVVVNPTITFQALFEQGAGWASRDVQGRASRSLLYELAGSLQGARVR